jgi:hypothetical protein
LDVIDTTDSLFAHKFFQRAGQNVLEIMLRRLAASKAQEEAKKSGEAQPTMTAAERKKEKNKQKKAAKKEENAAATAVPGGGEDKKPAAAASVAGGGGSKKGQAQGPVDEDPNGAKILEKDILEECSRWCQLLTKGGHCRDPKTLALVCEVMLKKEKYILALRCLTTGLSLDPTHPLLTFQLISFATQFYARIGLTSSSSAPASASSASGSPEEEEAKPPAVIAVVEEVVREKLQSLLGGEGSMIISTYLGNFIQRVTSSSSEALAVTVNHRLIAAKAIIFFQHGQDQQPAQRLQRAVSLLLDDNLWNQRGINFKNMLSVLQVRSSPPPPAPLLCVTTLC